MISFTHPLQVIERAKQILPIYLAEFRDCALKSLELDHRRRQNFQTFLLVSSRRRQPSQTNSHSNQFEIHFPTHSPLFLAQLNYFQQPGIQALHYLDVVQFKDVAHKSSFYIKFNEALPDVPKVSGGCLNGSYSFTVLPVRTLFWSISLKIFERIGCSNKRSIQSIAID